MQTVFDVRLPTSGLPRRVSGRIRVDELDGDLPAAVQVWPGTRSYTGQPSAEIHTIGAPSLLEILLDALYRRGAVPAERGEFTLRAFLAGRIDLLQAEAVLGIIDAADHEELQQALTQFGGGLTQRIRELRHDLIAMLGDLEAGLDFAEEDIEFLSAESMLDRLSGIRAALAGLLRDAEVRLPSGYHPRVVLAGLPNAGKSTLFNRLAGRELAIASDQAGTTRDYLSCLVSVGSRTVELVDTAGTADAGDAMTRAARDLSEQQTAGADLVLWCRSAGMSREECDRDAAGLEAIERRGTAVLRVGTRIDRRTRPADRLPEADVSVCARTGEGIADLRKGIAAALSGSRSVRQQLLATTAVRCRDSLRRAHDAVMSADQSVRQEAGEEITAVELREALHELKIVCGETWTDDILDHIFSHFCIGK